MIQLLHPTNGINKDEYMEKINKINCASLGLLETMNRFKLRKTPVAIGTNSIHYSWLKAAGVLGIGEHNMIGIAYDKDGRLCMQGKVSMYFYLFVCIIYKPMWIFSTLRE